MKQFNTSSTDIRRKSARTTAEATFFASSGGCVGWGTMSPNHLTTRPMKGIETVVGGLPGTGLYTIAVSWQSMADLTTPTANCANGLYGAETKRRTVSTTMRIADLY